MKDDDRSYVIVRIVRPLIRVDVADYECRDHFDEQVHSITHLF